MTFLPVSLYIEKCSTRFFHCTPKCVLVRSTIPKAGKLSGLELHVIIQVATYYFPMKAPASEVNIAESDKI